MRRYSAQRERIPHEFLAPYRRRWRLDYASFRPIEEEGRDMPLRRRNDLLHTDAFPRGPPTAGGSCASSTTFIRSRTRDWVVGEPFSAVVGDFTPAKIAVPASPTDWPALVGKRFAQATGLAKLVPQWKRTPYDEFMMRLHNTMKEDADISAQLAGARNFNLRRARAGWSTPRPFPTPCSPANSRWSRHSSSIPQPWSRRNRRRSRSSKRWRARKLA